VTRNDVVAFFDDFIAFGGQQRRMVAAHVYGKNFTAPGDDTDDDDVDGVGDGDAGGGVVAPIYTPARTRVRVADTVAVDAFKRSHEYHAVGYDVVDTNSTMDNIAYTS
jgi:hypothetical protein